MNIQLAELYLEAENDIKNNNFQDAIRKYDSIINEDPGNALAHNSMGWVYKTQMSNYSLAEIHYQAAVRSDPNHPHAYYNYAILLMDMERFEDLERLLHQMLGIKLMDKAWIYQRFGLASELRLNFDEAVEYYERAKLFSLVADKSKEYDEDLERCNDKQLLAEKHKAWIRKQK